jgi:hypothetical protein
MPEVVMNKDTVYPYILTTAIVITSAVLISLKSYDAKSGEIDTQAENEAIEAHVAKLDKINYLPSLLPLIIENSDVVELDQQQIDTLIAWRTENREKVLASMNAIVKKRVALKQAALSPDNSAESLVELQNDIFRLQRDVLNYKLSCRDLVIDTFNQNNWEGFYMVLASEGYAVDMPQLQVAESM